MKSIWIERKSRMSKRLKGWRRIRKGENLRPGQWMGNSYGPLMAHFLRWQSDKRDVAVIEFWDPAFNHGIIALEGASPPRRVSGAQRTMTAAISVELLRVVARHPQAARRPLPSVGGIHMENESIQTNGALAEAPVQITI